MVDLITAQKEYDALARKLALWAASSTFFPLRSIYNFLWSRALLLVATALVLKNRGANTAGVDRMKKNDVEATGIEKFADELATAIKHGEYNPSRVREVRVPKNNGTGETRTLSIPTLTDRIVERALQLLLEPLVEVHLAAESTAYRPGRGTSAGVRIVRAIVENAAVETIIETDILKFFPSIRHTLILEWIENRCTTDKRLLRLLRQLLQRGVCGNNTAGVGIAAGGPLSPLFANIVGDYIDGFLLARPEVVAHHRYADDMVIGNAGDAVAADKLRGDLETYLGTLGLELADKKTFLRRPTEWTRALGHQFRREEYGSVTICPADHNVRRLRKKLNDILTNKELNNKTKTEALNRITWSWVAYFHPDARAEDHANAVLDEVMNTAA